MTGTPVLSAPRRAALAAATAATKTDGETLVFDVGDIIAITDLFVITSGANTRQVRAVVDEIERALKAAAGDAPRSVEGLDDARWVLLDYGDLVVHVFLEETRAYYGLERLWADAPRVDWDGLGGAIPGTAAAGLPARAARA